jgi:anti-anti-sigma regulatory factor
MNEATGGSNSPRCAMGALAAFGLLGATLLAIGSKDYPNLHTILDTGMALLSGMLALLLWDMGSRLGRPLPKWLATSFAVTFVLEIVHVLITVEWSGLLAPIAASEHSLRPATWPPAAHVLPIGIAFALWQLHRGSESVRSHAVAVAGAGAGLFLAFEWLPAYTPPSLLGITRPALIFAPLLWLAVGFLSARMRASDRLVPLLTWVAAVLFLANTVMLFSRAPADAPAMVAHLGKIFGYLALLLSLMQIASLDMIERIRAEAELARLNQGLEQRVVERTTELERRSMELDRIAQDRQQAINRLGAANEALARQAEDIRRLSTPVLQLSERLLLLPIIGVIDTGRAQQLTERLLDAIRRGRVKAAVIDITGVVAVDSQVANVLSKMVQAARMMGATAIITGLSAEVAQALVGLGIDLTDVDTAGDLQSGLLRAERLLGSRLPRQAHDPSATSTPIADAASHAASRQRVGSSI